MTSSTPGPPGTLTPTYSCRPSGASAMPIPPPRYSPVVAGPLRVRYGMRPRPVRVAVSTTATPSAVATQARPSAPSASPYGAVPASTEPTGPRAGSTKVTVEPPKSVTRSVPCAVGTAASAADDSTRGAAAAPAPSGPLVRRPPLPLAAHPASTATPARTSAGRCLPARGTRGALTAGTPRSRRTRAAPRARAPSPRRRPPVPGPPRPRGAAVRSPGGPGPRRRGSRPPAGRSSRAG